MKTAQTIPYEQLENDNKQLRSENIFLREQLEWLKRADFR